MTGRGKPIVTIGKISPIHTLGFPQPQSAPIHWPKWCCLKPWFYLSAFHSSSVTTDF